MTEDEDIDAMLSRADATASRATEFAIQHIGAYAPFMSITEEVRDREIGDFHRIADTKVVRRSELLELARRDINFYIQKLKPEILLYPQLSSARLGVLAHVCIEIGYPQVKACRQLWDAISSNRWDDAADELQMTKWPALAAKDEDRRKVLELARTMRTGSTPAIDVKLN